MADLMYLVHLLQRVHLFRGLEPSDLATVARAAHMREVDREQYWFEAEAPADTVYLLQHGCVKITQSSSQGSPILLRFVGPGEIFGSMGALGDRLRPVAAQALSRCQALAWSAPAMARLMQDQPRIALNALGDLADQLLELQCYYRALPTGSVEPHLARKLIRCAEDGAQSGASSLPNCADTLRANSSSWSPFSETLR